MDSAKLSTFFLGLVAATVLFLLWKKEVRKGGSCGMGCSGNCGMAGASPACAASSAVQNALQSIGLDGQVSPTTAPLNSITGGGGQTSFYTNDGVTPDTAFTFYYVPRNVFAVGSPQQPGGLQGNAPGSNTTPAALTPVRATQQVASYDETGFIPRYSLSGIYIH